MFPTQSPGADMDRRSFVHRTAGGIAALGALRVLSACRPDAPSPAEDVDFIAVRERYFLRVLPYPDRRQREAA